MFGRLDNVLGQQIMQQLQQIRLAGLHNPLFSGLHGSEHSSLLTGPPKKLSAQMKLRTGKKYFKNDPIGQKKFEQSDGIIVPADEGKILMEDNNFIVKLTCFDKSVYGKAVKYNAPNGVIIVPRWMKYKLESPMSKTHTCADCTIHVQSVKLDKITKIKIKVPEGLDNPIDILEFELRNRNLLMVGEKITVKIFDLKIDFIVERMESGSKSIDIGLLYENNTSSDIIFDFDSNHIL